MDQPGVTEEDLRSYVRVYQATLKAAAEKLPEALRPLVLDVSNAGAGLYTSWTRGAAFELRDGETEHLRSTRLPEDFMFGVARGAGEPTIDLGSGSARLHWSNVIGARPFRLGAGAEVTMWMCNVSVGGDSRPVYLSEIDTDASPERWSMSEAVRRALNLVEGVEKAVEGASERGAGLLEGLAQTLRRSKESLVLVLGSFGEGVADLEAVRGVLGSLGYTAFRLDEVDSGGQGMTLEQKFSAIASQCRFLVFEDSTASGHLVEMMYANGVHAVSVVVHHTERPSTAMTAGVLAASRNISVHRYEPPPLEEVLKRGVEWAESRLEEMKGEAAF